MSNNRAEAVPESFPMTGGDGTYSYTKNSTLQRSATSVVKEVVDDAIADKLDVENLSTLNTFCLADLGCSIGPNTFFTMQNLIDAVVKKYQSKGLTFQVPEFQVLFNDHVANDFNTLFMSLPPETERQYFAAGVPGSFHGRLFPDNSLHIVHSSYALQWLSMAPKECTDIHTPTWNKGRISYTAAPEAIEHAYEAQFAKDMDVFLDSRAKELVSGGMMVLIIPGCPNDMPYDHTAFGIKVSLMESSIVEMAKAGKISEAQVDSFNLPIYVPTPREMAGAIERNGCYSIKKMELTDPLSKHEGPVDWKLCTMSLRSSMEGVFARHFGSEMMDEFFERLYKKHVEFSKEQMKEFSKAETQLLIILKRK